MPRRSLRRTIREDALLYASCSVRRLFVNLVGSVIFGVPADREIATADSRWAIVSGSSVSLNHTGPVLLGALMLPKALSSDRTCHNKTAKEYTSTERWYGNDTATSGAMYRRLPGEDPVP